MACNEEQIIHFLGQIKSKIELDGHDLESAVSAIKTDAQMLGISAEIIECIDIAEKRYEKSIEKVEYLRIPSIKRKHRDAWYSGPKEDDVYWPAFRNFLVEEKGWVNEINSINEASTKVVSLIDRPGLPSFSTRGLVVGYVQSGKTANMTSVIAKAADTNFRFFIILSGMTDALRTQTQERIEDDLISRNPEKWYPWTTRDDDFIAPPAGCFPNIQPSQRQYAVVKKVKSRLQSLLDVIRNTDTTLLRNLPVMIIDDECDQASVNSTKYRDEMTAINGLIREITHSLPRVAYIGYTATPFANVLIDPAYSVDTDNPDDLYPKDFITALPCPDNYFGAEKLFGRDLLDADEVAPEETGLDMIRNIPEEEIPYLRPKGRTDKDGFEPGITDSLEKAIKYYLMATAARCVRGDADKHSCMLVHTTVYTIPHFKQSILIKTYVDLIKGALKRNDRSFIYNMKNLWEEEQSKVGATRFSLKKVSFDEIFSYLDEVLNTVEFAIENSGSEERLDFCKVKNESGVERGRRYIVVGGSVLARGLTIEGLVVSFFLRTSSQYDSLMQMGRWFGYRGNYEDLPRVWMTFEMEDAFRNLALVEAEIRYDIDVYQNQELTPLEFAVRIRQIPGLAITAKNKMLAATNCSMSFSNEHRQTRKFKHKDREWLNNNWDAAGKLIDSSLDQGAGIEITAQGRYLSDIHFKKIIEFLNEYKIHETHEDMLSDRLIDYIREQNERSNGVLSKWNVGIIEPKSGSESQLDLGRIGKVKTSIRSLYRLIRNGDADIKALMSKSDLLIDLPDSSPAGQSKWDELKLQRIGENPLLLLYPIEAYSEPQRKGGGREPLDAVSDVMGLGIVFPKASKDTPIGYTKIILPETEYEELDIADDYNE